MKTTSELSLRSVAIGLVVSWAIYEIVWQLLICVSFGFAGVGLLRLILFTVKPMFLAASLIAGREWSRFVIGIFGIVQSVGTFLFGAWIFDPAHMQGDVILMLGAVGFLILSLVILRSRIIDELIR